jgi:hypothetical protein
VVSLGNLRPVTPEGAARAISLAKKAGDTLGGEFEISLTGAPAGLGGYSQGKRRLGARFAEAMFSIPAVKGFEVGAGFALAALPGSAAAADPSVAEFDALILPPVKGAWGHTLRQQAIRRGALLIAESAPQVGGVYLGPRNFERSQALGRFAAEQSAERGGRAEVLLVALEGLQNTRDRLEGFREGFRATFSGEVVFHRVDGAASSRRSSARSRTP